MAGYLTLDDVETAGRRVLVRSDLNVPLDGGEVADDFRIRAALGAVERLRSKGSVVVLCSHLGRPKGPDPTYSLAPVARRMEELGGYPVRHLPTLVGREVTEAVGGAEPGDVLLLENTRFHPGETSNDPALATRLADLADLFCQDAFGSVHRAHASTVGVAARVRSVAGPLLVSELEALGELLEDPPRPFVVILGGAKVSDKLGVLSAMVGICDVLVLGGGMSFTALAAEGYPVGRSLTEGEMVSTLRELLDGPDGGKVILPEDVVAAGQFRADAPFRVTDARKIGDDEMGLDIGPNAARRIAETCEGAGSIFWNGPMGVFEWEAFRSGTETVARAVASSGAFSVVGGGDSAAAIRLLGLENRVSHLSTGGGASLRLLEGKPLPGVEILEKWVR
ncbi:MAG: phosphoglycerate kinase [bacterium]|nr:phosphoglycerate kinase [bacterium]MDE0600493.1 phosphoglycerate kinase [bacterium]